MKKSRITKISRNLEISYFGLALMLVVSLLVAGCSGSSQNIGKGEKSQQDSVLEIKGSDTLLQVVSNLAEKYSEKNDAKISVTGGGSGTGIASLLNGEIKVADSSRPIKGQELKTAKDKGIDVSEFIIGRDMLSVVVNENNPVSELTIDQLSKIYKGEIKNWKEVGGSDQKITLYGRQSTSGTYVFFLEEVVKGEYSASMRNLEGSQAIVEAVRQDKTGIGYDGLGYVVENGKPLKGIKIIKLAKNKESGYSSPLDESKISEYPLSRPLYQYVAGISKESKVYNFLLFELSNEGQEIVKSSGFEKLSKGDSEKNKVALEKIK